jgi:hypothetical protein
MCAKMDGMLPNQTRIEELRKKLSEVDAQFREAARKRGFDPDQAENLALPSNLAKLFLEREEIKNQLEELVDEKEMEG